MDIIITGVALGSLAYIAHGMWAAPKKREVVTNDALLSGFDTSRSQNYIQRNASSTQPPMPTGGKTIWDLMYYFVAQSKTPLDVSDALKPQEGAGFYTRESNFYNPVHRTL